MLITSKVSTCLIRVGMPLIVLALLLVACQDRANQNSVEDPQPAQWTLEADEVLTDLDKANLPVERIDVEPAELIVVMVYSYQTNPPSNSTPDADIVAIAKHMCAYDRGYSLKVVFSDGWSLYADWHLIRSLCDGYGVGGGVVITEDNLIEESGKYQPPAEDYPI